MTRCVRDAPICFVVSQLTRAIHSRGLTVGAGRANAPVVAAALVIACTARAEAARLVVAVADHVTARTDVAIIPSRRARTTIPTADGTDEATTIAEAEDLAVVLE